MSRRMIALTLLVAAAIATTTAYARLRQEPKQPLLPRLAAVGVQMTASGKFVYVLRGDEISQFDAASLEFIKKVKLPKSERVEP